MSQMGAETETKKCRRHACRYRKNEGELNRGKQRTYSVQAREPSFSSLPSVSLINSVAGTVRRCSCGPAAAGPHAGYESAHLMNMDPQDAPVCKEVPTRRKGQLHLARPICIHHPHLLGCRIPLENDLPAIG